LSKSVKYFQSYSPNEVCDKHFNCYIFVHIYLFYSNIQLYLSQHLEHFPNVPLANLSLCCTFFSMEHAATLQFYHSFFFSVLYSGYKIFLLSCSDTLPSIAFFLSHFIYYTLIIFSLLASPSLQFHASWQKLYYTFLTCLLRKKPCP